ISNATWQNMKGAVISQNDLNDRVKLDVKGENLEGKNIEFTLYKDVAWWFDEKISQTSSQAWTTWKTNESGVFYFKAKLSDRTEIQSGDLIVLEFQNDSFPISKIKKPKNRDIYFLNENIEFTQTSYDEDDFIDYTWDLGDGNLRNGSAEKNYLNYDFVYSYGVAGQKNIILNARSERGLDVKNKTSVLVIDLSENKKYVFADISVPWIKDSVKGNIVKFDASGSYAIEVLDGEIKCIAGNCPSQTSNGTLILNLNQLLDDLSFNWTFDDGSKRNGVGIGGAKFDKVFMNGGIKSVNLIVSINPFSETETEFVVFLENSVCDISSGGWWESGSFSLGMNDCYRINGVPSNFCCPQEYTCSGLEDGTGQCVFSEVQICSDYDNEEDCNNYELHVAEFDNQEKSGIEKFCSKSYYNQTDDCTYYRNCKCKWENSVCAPLYELNAYCSGEDKGTLLTCYRPNIETTNCTSSGYRYITWDGYYVDKTQNILKCISDFNCGDYSNNFENLYCNQGICASDVCSGGKKTIPCISTALLGFFDIINLIISLLIIVIFYVIVLRKSRSFKKDLLGK
ncbi:MAG: PKD domain-containing protein, partial [Nanoarchaeota archaeon]|nr:PKD domain-containing protein [Nanoarchaeota archaeon]